MKSNKWILAIVLISSCGTLRTGNFQAIGSRIEKKITINSNHNFVLSFNVDACGRAVNAGVWWKRGRYLYLTYIGNQFSYFKHDTIISGKDDIQKPAIRVTVNGGFPMDSVQLKVNNADQIYFADRSGDLFINRKMELDSILVKRMFFINKWTTFKIPKGHNDILIYLYDPASEPCGFFYMPTRLRVKSGKILEDEVKNRYTRY